MKQQPRISTLSELLATSLADARRLDRDQYQPRYRNWHFPNSQGFCEICLGGSFVAGTLGCAPTREASPWDFPRKTHAKIEALNAMRSGAWIEAYRLFYVTPSTRTTPASHRHTISLTAMLGTPFRPVRRLKPGARSWPTSRTGAPSFATWGRVPTKWRSPSRRRWRWSFPVALRCLFRHGRHAVPSRFDDYFPAAPAVALAQ